MSKTTEDFTAKFVVNQTPDEIFDAILNVKDWWPGEIEGDTHKKGGIFTYRYKDAHYSKQKITELIPNKKVSWLVIDSYLGFVEDKTEWNGTSMIFDISNKDGKATLVFTHRGLVPQVACYEKCAPAWTFIIKDSLFKLITAGKNDLSLNK